MEMKMYKFKPKRVLVLAPHTDDGEFGCGGSMARFLDERVEVFSAAFSSCSKSVPQGFPNDILVSEYKSANLALGVKKNNILLFDYDVRTFPSKRQEILDDLVSLRKDIAPDLVFMPSVYDIHQDHLTLAEEGLRAFKNSTILCYEVPWNNISFCTSSFIHLKAAHVNKKILALSNYKSQTHRNYAAPEFIRALALTRGVQISARYAEAFNVIRLVVD